MNMISKFRILVHNTVCPRRQRKGLDNKLFSACTLGVVGLFIILFSNPVFAQNTRPNANAGDDQNVFVGQVVQLHGTAIDSNGDLIVSWTWSIDAMPMGSTAFLSNPNVQSPTLMPFLEGRYRVSLVVSDGLDESLPDTVVIQVKASMIPVSIPEETEGKVP